MKCAPIKLTERSEYSRQPNRDDLSYTEATFVTKQCSTYLLSFIRKTQNSNKSTLSINSLQLPEWVHSYNSGYSLDRWRNKKPKLRCKTAPLKKSPLPEALETFSNSIETIKDDLDALDNQNEQEDSCSNNEMNSDIEELFRRSHRYEDTEEDEGHGKRKKDKSRRHSRRKRKSRKTIRYSLSKPASPETEKIIRVDVTSSVPIEDLEPPPNKVRNQTKSSASVKLSGETTTNKHFSVDEEDCLIKCQQLVLTPK